MNIRDPGIPKLDPAVGSTAEDRPNQDAIKLLSKGALSKSNAFLQWLKTNESPDNMLPATRLLLGL